MSPQSPLKKGKRLMEINTDLKNEIKPRIGTPRFNELDSLSTIQNTTPDMKADLSTRNINDFLQEEITQRTTKFSELNSIKRAQSTL
jgi:predicted component of type VI protein secretion system